PYNLQHSGQFIKEHIVLELRDGNSTVVTDNHYSSDGPIVMAPASIFSLGVEDWSGPVLAETIQGTWDVSLNALESLGTFYEFNAGQWIEVAQPRRLISVSSEDRIALSAAVSQ